jgi:hypothetical protein
MESSRECKEDVGDFYSNSAASGGRVEKIPILG